ncbi:MAG: hypothetical protein IJ336_03330 [Lachnospiraceae bacterium]|nr:hypothetical protein [Lachnospiraceae bacterium]
MISENKNIGNLIKYIVNIQLLMEMERGYHSFCHTGNGDEIDYTKQNMFLTTAHRLEMENLEILAECLLNENTAKYFEHCMHNFVEMHDPESGYNYLIPDKENLNEYLNSSNYIGYHMGHGIMSCLTTSYENSILKKNEHKKNIKSKFTLIK